MLISFQVCRLSWLRVVCTYSTRIVRESSRVRVGACRGPGGSWEVSMVTCELLEQPLEVHALSTRTWVEYTPSPEKHTHRQWRSRKACAHTHNGISTQNKPWIPLWSRVIYSEWDPSVSQCVDWNIPQRFFLLAQFSFRFSFSSELLSIRLTAAFSSLETRSLLVYTV